MRKVLATTTTAADTSFEGMYTRLFPPRHIVDGPCVKTAPFQDEFVEHRQALRVTCPACLVFMKLEEVGS